MIWYVYPWIQIEEESQFLGVETQQNNFIDLSQVAVRNQPAVKMVLLLSWWLSMLSQSKGGYFKRKEYFIAMGYTSGL